MNDAEARLAERLAEDLERILGAGIVVRDVRIEGDGPVRIDVACLAEGRTREIHAEAENAVAAMAEVIRLAAELRLTAAFWHLVGPA